MKTTTKLKVRTYECDSYGHVNNAVYLNYLEFARMDYLMQIGFRYNDFVKAGYFTYVTHIDIHYKASAYFNDELTIEVEPTKLGAVSGTLHQIIKNEQGLICAEADVTWGAINSQGRPSKIPQEFMAEGLKP